MTLLAISADSHVTEPGDCYVDRIDPKFRDRAPVATTDDTMGAVMLIDNGRSRIPYGMVAAAGRPPETINPSPTSGGTSCTPAGGIPRLACSSRTATASSQR